MNEEDAREAWRLFKGDETFLNDPTPEGGWLAPIVLNYEGKKPEEFPFPNRDEIHAELLIAAMPHIGRALTAPELTFLYTLQEAYNVGLAEDVFMAGELFDGECDIADGEWCAYVIEHFFEPVANPEYKIGSLKLRKFMTNSIDALVDLEIFRDENGEIIPAKAEEVKEALQPHTGHSPFDDPAFVDLIGAYIQNGGKLPKRPDFCIVQRDEQIMDDVMMEELLLSEKQILYGLVKLNHLLTFPYHANGRKNTYNEIIKRVARDGVHLEKLSVVEYILLQELLDSEYDPRTTNQDYAYARIFVCKNIRQISGFLNAANLLIASEDYADDPETYDQLREEAKECLFEAGVRTSKRDLVMGGYDLLKKLYERKPIPPQTPPE